VSILGGVRTPKHSLATRERREVTGRGRRNWIPGGRRNRFRRPADESRDGSPGEESTVHEENVYLGLGSNLGDRSGHLRAGIDGLSDGGLRLRAVSSFYLTEPDLGVASSGEDVEHPDYVNCVAAFDSDLEPRALLDLCMAVERSRGRERPRDTTNGPQPRTLDIDVLLIGQRVVDEPGLKVPHPSMMQRRFVLQPLAEIAPSLRHPIAKTTFHEALERLPDGNGVALLEPPPDEVI